MNDYTFEHNGFTYGLFKYLDGGYALYCVLGSGINGYEGVYRLSEKQAMELSSYSVKELKSMMEDNDGLTKYLLADLKRKVPKHESVW